MKKLRERFNSIWMKIPKPYPALVKLAVNYDSRWKKGTDILFLGDSVVERISWNDTDKRTIDQMTADLLSSGKSLMCISQAAYHFNIYFHLLNVLRATRHRPQLVILPVNMRCFSPQWDLNPAWQFEEEIRALQAYPQTKKIPAIRINADALPFSETDWNMEFEFPFTDLKRVGQFFELIKNIPDDPDGKFHRRKQIYILHYLKKLSQDHRRLQSLAQILGLLNDLQIRALVYITPINYQGGVRHVGQGFIDGIRENAAILNDVVRPYMQTGLVRFMDLQENLTSDHFFHADELTEHLNQNGRMKLAHVLADEIENSWIFSNN